MSVCSEFAKKAKHRIVIESYTQTVDSFGAPVEAWSAFATVWAAIKPMSGNEQVIQEQLQATATHKFTIRYRSDLEDPTTSAKYRISWNSRLFNIRQVRNIETENRFLELVAEEGVET